MATSIDICNMALHHLGTTKLITAFSDATEEARACGLFYDPARKHVLASFPWNFACKFATLALVSGGDPHGYTYAYQLPSDNITVRKIFNESYQLGPIDFKVVGQELWTNQEDVVIEYTYDLTVENLFDAAFITALSHKLAADLAMPLSKKRVLAESQLTAYFGYLSIAGAVNACEGLDAKEKTDDLLAARS